MNHYDILEITKDAGDREIQAAYRRKAKQSHPDVGGDVVEFSKIQEAYEVLSDPVERQKYDNDCSVEFVENPLEYVHKLWTNLLKGGLS